MTQKIGIIGAGGMLQYHAPGFKAGGAEIVAICDMNQEAASQTADAAGDGTTTSTVLAHEFYTKGLKAIATGASPIEVKRGMDKAVKEVVKSLKTFSKDVTTNEEIKQIATISAPPALNPGA